MGEFRSLSILSYLSVYLFVSMDLLRNEKVAGSPLKGCDRNILDNKILQTLTKHLKTFNKYNISLKEFLIQIV